MFEVYQRYLKTKIQNSETEMFYLHLDTLLMMVFRVLLQAIVSTT